ncbi:MAG: zinc ribbon domain-containing protein [Planctomycetia bacterium]|nr:zinc ribbon domain-containing protein [Planctomycetia bacterium]
MKCPSCETTNAPTASTCSACGKPLKPRRKRRDDEESAPLTPEAAAFIQRATWLFRFGLLSLVPGLGLVLGPLAMLGAIWMRGPEQPGRGLVRIGFVFGLLSTLCQWVGMGLILYSTGAVH